MVVTGSANELTLSGQIVGSSPLVLDGAGTLILSNSTNSFSGGTYVNSGTLIIANDGAIPAGSSLTVGASALFGTVAPDLHLADVAAVPEPGTVALFIAGLVTGFGVWQRKKRVRIDRA
jgi:autotransporter-associated beta strand protein